MEEKKFSALARGLVAEYNNEVNPDHQITPDDVYFVWMCKTLQNSKALASTILPDGMYYEISYNGDKNELYFDAYKKFENRCIPAE